MRFLVLNGIKIAANIEINKTIIGKFIIGKFISGSNLSGEITSLNLQEMNLLLLMNHQILNKVV